jgi:peptide-methionine (S)-S-oxide reductase
MPELPARPSAEHLRKAAKRLARKGSLRLALAQLALAQDYGFRDWSALMRHVAEIRGVSEASVPPLVAAVRANDVTAVRDALAAGANPRVFYEGETPLHTAARRGTLAVVEALIEGGALERRTDASGRTPLEVARRGRGPERAAIVALLDRHAISDASFREAVASIHRGDVARLEQLLDAEPRLLNDRILGPEVYRKRKRHDYFRDPKLFWYVANNPTIVERMAPNIVDVARAMIARGVAAEDLDYPLGLVMTSRAAREQGHQRPLMHVLLAAGARATRETIVSTAAHWELDALRALVEAGLPLDAPLAATFGEVAALRALLPTSSREDVTLAFGLAVINRELETARLALEAGADVNAFLPVHAHSTALHQAAGDDNVPMIAMLLQNGANRESRDTLWDGTPLGWALFAGHAAAAAELSRGVADETPHE